MDLNKPYSTMTLPELKEAYAHWDLKIRSLSSWGSAMAFADSQRSQIEREIERREDA